jgi:hypothetical protein
VELKVEVFIAEAGIMCLRPYCDSMTVKCVQATASSRPACSVTKGVCLQTELNTFKGIDSLTETAAVDHVELAF